MDALLTSPSFLHPILRQNELMSGEAPRYKRSEYLKNGCRECKRRKIKCDEFVNPPGEAYLVINHQGRELCWNCTRLKKICDYPKKDERVARVSRKFLMDSEKGLRSPQLPSSLTSPFDAMSTYKPSAPDEVMTLSMGRTAAMPDATHAPGHVVYPNYLMSSQDVTRDSINIPRDTYGVSKFCGAPVGAGSVPTLSYALYPLPPADHGFPQYPLGEVGYAAELHAFGPSCVVNNRPGRVVSHGAEEGVGEGKNVPGTLFLHGLPRDATPTMSLASVQLSMSTTTPNSESNSMLLSGTSVRTDLAQMNESMPGPYEPSDLALLATDVKNLIEDMMFELGGVARSRSGSEATSMSHGSPSGLFKKSPRAPEHAEVYGSRPPPHVLLASLASLTPREQQYLEEFCHGFSAYTLPFEVRDPVLRNAYNQILDVILALAAREPVLLAVILSQSARAAHAKSNAPRDEDAHYNYLQRCLRILGPAVGSADKKGVDELTSSIEGILLTVLLLTSSNAANAKQNRISQLYGTKDILLRKTAPASRVVVLCKLWFASFELVEGLSLAHCGTLRKPTEMDNLLDFDAALQDGPLRDFGLVSENGFCLLTGFHVALVPMLRDVVKLLNKKRATPSAPLCDTSEYLRVLAALEQHGTYAFVDARGIFPAAEFPLGEVPPGLVLEPLPGASAQVVSWMDLLNQLYVAAAKVTVLREFFGLAYASTQIQAFAQQFHTWLAPLARGPALPSVLMMQWSLLVYGTILVREEDRQLVTSLFQHAKLRGAGGAGHSLARLARLWKTRDSGAADYVDDNDTVDLVNY